MVDGLFAPPVEKSYSMAKLHSVKSSLVLNSSASPSVNGRHPLRLLRSHSDPRGSVDLIPVLSGPSTPSINDCKAGSFLLLFAKATVDLPQPPPEGCFVLCLPTSHRSFQSVQDAIGANVQTGVVIQPNQLFAFEPGYAYTS
jgi:hypothetical protein